MNEDKKEKIKVTDKRKFDSKGNPRKSQKETPEESGDDKKKRSRAAGKKAPEKPDADKKTAQETSTDTKTESKTEGEGTSEKKQKIAIDFSTFIYSLGTQAMMAMGLVPDPISKKQEVNLDGAQQLIDIIAMLREKTRGNLEGQEITFMDNLLFELRMRYVELTRN